MPLEGQIQNGGHFWRENYRNTYIHMVGVIIYVFRVSEHEYVIYKTIEATVFPNICMPLTEDVQGRLQL